MEVYHGNKIIITYKREVFFMKGDINALFHTMKIGTMEVKNIIAMAPMGLHSKNPE